MVLQIPPAMEGTAGRLPASDGKGETGDVTMPDILQDKEKKNKSFEWLTKTKIGKRVLGWTLACLTVIGGGIGINAIVNGDNPNAAYI